MVLLSILPIKKYLGILNLVKAIPPNDLTNISVRLDWRTSGIETTGRRRLYCL